MWSMIEMMHKELASLVVNAGQGILTSFDHTILCAVLSLLSLWQSHPNSADRPVCIRLRSIWGESFNLSRSKKRQTPALPPSFSLSCRGVNSLKVAWPAAPSRALCFLPSIVAQLFVEPFKDPTITDKQILQSRWILPISHVLIQSGVLVKDHVVISWICQLF